MKKVTKYKNQFMNLAKEADNKFKNIKSEIDKLCSVQSHVNYRAAEIIIEIYVKVLFENYELEADAIGSGLKNKRLKKNYDEVIYRWEDEFVYIRGKILKYFKTDREHWLAKIFAHKYISCKMRINDPPPDIKKEKHIAETKEIFCNAVKRYAELNSIASDKETRAFIKQCKNDCIRLINNINV